MSNIPPAAAAAIVSAQAVLNTSEIPALDAHNTYDIIFGLIGFVCVLSAVVIAIVMLIKYSRI